MNEILFFDVIFFMDDGTYVCMLYYILILLCSDFLLCDHYFDHHFLIFAIKKNVVKLRDKNV
jgi:hypothetical protein